MTFNTDFLDNLKPIDTGTVLLAVVRCYKLEHDFLVYRYKYDCFYSIANS
jgi:hypothetical protein